MKYAIVSAAFFCPSICLCNETPILPELSQTAPFSVLGVYGNNSLLVESEGNTFICLVERKNRTEERLLGAYNLRNCNPILTETAAEVAIQEINEAEKQAAIEAAKAKELHEKELAEVLEAAILKTLAEYGCEANLKNDAEANAYFDRMDSIALELAIEQAVELPVGDLLNDAYASVYADLTDRGIVSYNEDSGIEKMEKNCG